MAEQPDAFELDGHHLIERGGVFRYAACSPIRGFASISISSATSPPTTGSSQVAAHRSPSPQAKHESKQRRVLLRSGRQVARGDHGTVRHRAPLDGGSSRHSFIGAAVIGSGIMAAKLAGGNTAIALLCNTLRPAPFSS